MDTKRHSILGKSFIIFSIIFSTGLVSILFIKSDLAIFLQFIIILYFSFLPAWIYLQFISTKGKTLWDEYVLNLYRLRIDHPAYLPQPPKHSLYYKQWEESHESIMKLIHRNNKSRMNGEIGNGQFFGGEPTENIYQKKFESLYGVAPVGELRDLINDFRQVISPQSGSFLMGPVLIATVMITLGWILVVEPMNVFQFQLFKVSAESISSIVNVPWDTLKFGILGAYFYILQMLIRRYFQNDLRKNAYVSVIMRYIVVILLVWVMDEAWRGEKSDYIKALAFVIGVFPHIGWKVIVALIKLPIKSVVPSLKQEYPLSDLDGLNIWYESRLLEEGIEDMQNLATANLVDLMLNTRIPVERLVDWVDQATLFLHLSRKQKDGPDYREKLRKYGVRTATDLDDIFFPNDTEMSDKLEKDKLSQASLNRIIQDPLIMILDDPEIKVKPERAVLFSVIRALKKAPNFYHIRQWKRYSTDQTKLFLELKKKEEEEIKNGKEGILLNMQTEVKAQLKKLKLTDKDSDLIMRPLVQSLASLRNKENTAIEFFNQLDESIQICWVNPEEEERVSYKELVPLASYTQYTYVGSEWKVSLVEGDVHLYRAIGESKPITIKITNEGILKDDILIKEEKKKQEVGS